MKRYSSVQPAYRSAKIDAQDEQSQKSAELKLEDMEVMITKIKREEIKIKTPWHKVPNQIIHCGKHHEDNQEHSQASTQKWIENRIKKRNQDRVLLKALNLKSQQDTDHAHPQEYDRREDNHLDNQSHSKMGQNGNTRSSGSPHLRLEKVLWKKRMINELHGINKFMDSYNGDNRQERENKKRQQIIGDLIFDDGDKKKLKQHQEQKERMNQLHKKLYGHESLERVQAKGLVKELLQDFIQKQIRIGIQEKEDVTQKISSNSTQKSLKIGQNMNDNRQETQNNMKASKINEQTSPIERKIKSKSMHGSSLIRISERSPNKKLLHSEKKNEREKMNGQNNNNNNYGDTTMVNTSTMQNNISQLKKTQPKTKSDMQFDYIAKISKQINDRIVKDYNELHGYSYAESQDIRNELQKQLLSQNRERQSLIELEYHNQQIKKRENDDLKNQSQLLQIDSDNALPLHQNSSQDDLFKSIVFKKYENGISTYHNLGNDGSQSDLTDQKHIAQRSSLDIIGDSELGKEYFRYLKQKNNEVDFQKQENDLKERLQNNQSFQKILAMKKIQSITKLQNFYEEYSNHIQRKVLKNDLLEKMYTPKPDYKSLSVLQNMQRKAEFEEEEKLRILKEEQDKLNAKKKRVFRQFQSQHALEDNTTTNNNQTKNKMNEKNNVNTEGANNLNNKILQEDHHFAPNSQQNKYDNDQSARSLISSLRINHKVQNDKEQQNTQSKGEKSPLRPLKYSTQTSRVIQDTETKQFFNYSNVNPNQKSREKQDQIRSQTSRSPMNQIRKDQNIESLEKPLKQNDLDYPEIHKDEASLFKSNDNQPQKNPKQNIMYKLIIKQQEHQPEYQEVQSPLLKRLPTDKISQQIDYYTPQKIQDGFSKQRDCFTSYGKRNTTAETPEIKNNLRNSSTHRKSESVGRLRSSQALRNVSIPNLSTFEKANSQNISIVKPNLNSNTSFIEKVQSLNNQCKFESLNVHKITKNLLLRQRRNVRTFTKLDNMINNIV